jgi:hypothetical protein
MRRFICFGAVPVPAEVEARFAEVPNVSEMAKWRQISYPQGSPALDPKWKAPAVFLEVKSINFGFRPEILKMVRRNIGF